MAIRTPKTIQQLANDAAKGIIHNTTPLRDNILNPSELNQLKLLDNHLDDLMDIIQAPDLDTGLSQNQSTIMELDIAAAQSFDDGYLVSDNTSYTQLKKYIDVLNKDRPAESKYHLGHETGIYTYYLKILRENYNPDTSAKSDVGKAIVRRQKALLDNALRASLVIDSLNKKAISDLRSKGLGTGHSAADLKLVLESAGFGINLDTEVKKDITKLIKSGKAKITLTAELESDNLTTGNLSGVLSKMVKASFGSGKVKGGPIDEILSHLDPTGISGSPDIMQTIGASLTASGKRTNQPKMGVSKATKSAKIRANNQSAVRLKRRINKRLGTLQTYLIAKKQHKKFVLPTVTLKALINESLAEFIRLRMGSPSEAAVRLRNQTGRFSESAYLLTLNRTKAGELVGTYDFMKDPYGTFLPGGRLHTQQRDPKLYIEGAIRDIAAKVLKGKFKGIALELK